MDYVERLPCKYFGVGCIIFSLPSEKLNHEEMCDYRLCNCPYPVEKCYWEGTRLLVAPHLAGMHQVLVVQGEAVTFVASEISTSDMRWVLLQACFDNHFMLVVTKRQTTQGFIRFYALAQFLGSRRTAQTFKCRMELVGVGKRLVWEGKPLCIYDSVSIPDSSTDCFIFSNDTSAMFAEQRTLRIQVTISVAA